MDRPARSFAVQRSAGRPAAGAGREPTRPGPEIAPERLASPSAGWSALRTAAVADALVKGAPLVVPRLRGPGASRRQRRLWLRAIASSARSRRRPQLRREPAVSTNLPDEPSRSSGHGRCQARRQAQPGVSTDLAPKCQPTSPKRSAIGESGPSAPSVPADPHPAARQNVPDRKSAARCSPTTADLASLRSRFGGAIRSFRSTAASQWRPRRRCRGARSTRPSTCPPPRRRRRLGPVGRRIRFVRRPLGFPARGRPPHGCQ